MIPPLFGKQEVGIWRVKKHFPQYGVPIYMKLVIKYQISAINSCWEKCDEKCAYMFNVYKNQLSRQTGSKNLTSQKTLPTIWYTYIYDACDQISDLCHQQLLRKMWRKISWTDGQTDRGKTVINWLVDFCWLTNFII